MVLVISESCYKVTFTKDERNYRKMTISSSFFYNSSVKCHGEQIWEPQHDNILSISMIQ